MTIVYQQEFSMEHMCHLLLTVNMLKHGEQPNGEADDGDVIPICQPVYAGIKKTTILSHFWHATSCML